MSQNSFSINAIKIFKQSIDKYHLINSIDQPFKNPYPVNSINYLLYKKNWIDTVQWHYEDLIRDPKINPVKGMDLKRKIDASNTATVGFDILL